MLNVCKIKGLIILCPIIKKNTYKVNYFLNYMFTVKRFLRSFATFGAAKAATLRWWNPIPISWIYWSNIQPQLQTLEWYFTIIWLQLQQHKMLAKSSTKVCIVFNGMFHKKFVLKFDVYYIQYSVFALQIQRSG